MFSTIVALYTVALLCLPLDTVRLLWEVLHEGC